MILDMIIFFVVFMVDMCAGIGFTMCFIDYVHTDDDYPGGV